MTEFEIIPANLARRLAALVYDSLLMFAVLIIASAFTLPFTGGKGTVQHHPLLTIYFLGIIFLFNGWFWTHGGQTLGMRAWRIQILKRNGEKLGWQLAFVRFLLSLPFWAFVVLIAFMSNSKTGITVELKSIPGWIFYSIAIVWLLVDQQPDNWRDRLGKCRVRYYDKNKL